MEIPMKSLEITMKSPWKSRRKGLRHRGASRSEDPQRPLADPAARPEGRRGRRVRLRQVHGALVIQSYHLNKGLYIMGKVLV